ncbi:MAG: Fic family protein, partial [Candidatus Margulisiibacteriota bacterium]
GNIIPQLNGYKAFIPHMLLSFKPEIKIDNELLNLLSEADRALGELNGISDLLPDPDLFVAYYVKKEALLSSQIEGTQCSLDEVIKADPERDALKPVHEVVNYIDAMNFGLDQLQNIPMSLRLIHEIHKRLLSGVRGREKTPGQYKKTQNWVGPPGSTLSEAVYIPPPPHMILELMGDIENYYHQDDSLPLLIKAAIIHFQFETIHPYLDGNGRLGRLLITFMLCERKILNKPLLYLSLFFKEYKTEYYDLLMNVRFKGTWEDWIKFFLRGVRNTSREAIKTIREILTLQEKHRALIKSSFIKYSFSLPSYDFICNNPIFSIPELAKGINATYPSAKQIVSVFSEAGIVHPYQQLNKTLFSYQEYFDILKRGTEQ